MFCFHFEFYRFLASAVVATPPSSSSSSIEHLICYSFHLSVFCVGFSAIDVVCGILCIVVSLSPNYRMLPVCMRFHSSMYIDRFYAICMLNAHMHLFRFSVIYLIWVCSVSFNECICSNHSNWARYTKPFCFFPAHLVVFLVSFAAFLLSVSIRR